MTRAEISATEPDPVVDVALIVVTFNSAEDVDGLLASIAGALDGLRARVVVVDNNSSDDTVDRLLAHPGVEVVALAENRGYSAAINAGLSRTRTAPTVVLLNPDLTLAPASIRTLLAASHLPGTGIVVPQMRNPDGTVYPSLRREPTVARAWGAAIMGGSLASRFPSLSETIGVDRSYLERGEVDWATGAAMLVTRECADVTGQWDESFFLYSEETDFASRARSAGFRVVFEPAAVVTHVGGECATSARLRSMLVVNRVRYFRRRHGRMRTAAFYLGVVVNELIRGAVGDPVQRPAARFAARTLIRRRLRPSELAASTALLSR